MTYVEEGSALAKYSNRAPKAFEHDHNISKEKTGMLLSTSPSSIFSERHLYSSSEGRYENIGVPTETSNFTDDKSFDYYSKQVINFIEKEMKLCQILYFGKNVYEGLLSSEEQFSTLFSEREKLLIFGELNQLFIQSRSFLTNLINSLNKSRISDKSSDQYRMINVDTFFAEFNITELVVNSDPRRLNFGTLLYNYICSNDYKRCVQAYFLKEEFRAKVLQSVISSNATTAKLWLQQADFTLEYNGLNYKIHDILNAPKDMFNAYSGMIKRLNDASGPFIGDIDLHNLNLSLISLAMVKDKIRKSKQVISFEALNDQEASNVKGKLYFDNELTNTLEQYVSDANSFKLKDAPSCNNKAEFKQKRVLSSKNTMRSLSNLNSEPDDLKVYFKDKKFFAKKLKNAFDDFCKNAIKFIQIQHTYAVLWKEVLDNKYASAFYHSYIDKIEVYANSCNILITEILSQVVNPLEECIAICDHFEACFDNYKTQKAPYLNSYKEKSFVSPLTVSNGRDYKFKNFKEFERKLKTQVPLFVSLMDDLVSLVWKIFVEYYNKWLYSLVGQRYFNDFLSIRSQEALSPKTVKNGDILQNYGKIVALNRIALEEAGISYKY